jgi:hypothetical protein
MKPFGGKTHGGVYRLLPLKPSVLIPESYIIGEAPALPVYERVGSIDHSKILDLVNLGSHSGEVETRENTFLLA